MFSSIGRALAGAMIAIASVNVNAQATISSVASSLPSNTLSPPPPSSSSPSSSSSSPCNNSPSLCNRKYNNITYMGAHDAAFLRDQTTDNSIAGNQNLNATLALSAGLRMLQAQVHNSSNQLHLCHTSCGLLDAGPLATFLSAINDWMVGHPTDVVTILLVNSDNMDVSLFADAFSQSGLAQFGYTPPSPTEWPTLQSMISNGTRMVSFITNINATSEATYLLPEFNYVFETPFTVTTLTGFNCTVNRPSGIASAAAAFGDGLMGLANHFKDVELIADILIPDTGNITIVNSDGDSTDGNLGLHLEQCRSGWDNLPSFVLVDFWDNGTTVQAADTMNGVTDATGRENVTALSAQNATSSAEGAIQALHMETGALVAFFVAALLMA